ncbi:MAG: hypothetical protein AVO39_04350 [delta proteobacterium MLS_D]|jgi:bifunctional oligoribonuclease and PAP phosphatase NrnA|nr:MAG: hypothetical protein AVO39_04350 [delta proteobacterium MLS_D]
MPAMLDRIVDAVRSAKTVLLVSHVRPDGDALGSIIAFYHVLKSLGKEVVVFSQDKIPDMYRFLPGAEAVVHTLGPVERFDTALLLDCSELSRVGDEADRIGSIGTLIVIDHHLSNNGSIPLSLVDTKASSTGEILVDLIDRLDVELTSDIAVNIYTAVVTDTGSFRYSNTTGKTFMLAARLVEAGADPRTVSEQVYETKPLVRLRLMSRAMETLKISRGGEVGSIVLDQHIMKEEDALPEHTEGLVDMVRSVQGVRVAVFYYEMPDGAYKISLRSKGTANVEHVAKIFGGGGHRNASACRMQGNIQDIQEQVLAAVDNILRETES